MRQERAIREIVNGKATRDGAGVRLTRVFTPARGKDLDPFLLLDAFDSDNPEDYTKGFPWHPHRGIETVTYLIQGRIEHGDSLGNTGSIDEGCCQWMSAGSGIVHQEMPQASPRMLGVQLWVNLPAAGKMSPPAYRDVRKEDVTVVEEEDATVRIIAGSYKGQKGPVSGISVDPVFLDADVKPGREFLLETRREDTLFAYILQGEGDFGEEQGEKTGILFTPGDFFKATAGPQGLRMLIFSGRKLGEPVAWRGPVVMNTREELDQAFQELEEGTFLRKRE
ncbi:MAG: pirin family protein [Clostridia bacterium]